MPLGGLVKEALGVEDVAKPALRFAYNAGRSKIPFLGQAGSGLADTLGFNALNAKDAIKGTAGSFKMTTQPAFRPQSTVKAGSDGSPRETAALGWVLKMASGDPAWHRYVNAASYGAFALPYLSERVHDNHRLTTALNAAGLLGLGLTSADKVRHGDDLSLYDVGGLGLMGAGMIHGALRPDEQH